MQTAPEHSNDKKTTSQYWGFRELNDDELQLIGGGDSDDGDGPSPASGGGSGSLPDIYAFGSSGGSGVGNNIGIGGSSGLASSGGSPEPSPPPPPDPCLDGIMAGALGGAMALPVGGPVLAIGTLLVGVVGGGCFRKGGPGSFRE